jgi:hypothetical protein
MQIPERTRWIGDEDDLQLWWEVSGSLINFSSGYTFSLTLARVSTPATIIFTKTTGFAGALGSGEEGEEGAIPNLVVSFATTGELNSVTAAGQYTLQIVATHVSDSKETTLQMTLNMKKRLGS